RWRIARFRHDGATNRSGWIGSAVGGGVAVMECLYINLDTATDRRTSIENSFDKYRRGNWTLRRVIGVDAASIETAQISGILSSAQKACVLSHRKAVGESLGNDDHVMISEDDTIFGESTFKHIDAILAPK